MKTHSENILVLTATTRDAMLAARSLEAGGVKAHICPHPLDLQQALHAGAGALLLAEEACSAEVLAILEEFLETQPPWSDLPLIFLQIAGAGVESPLISRLRQRGNLSLLERPLRQSTLFYAIETALRARRRQYQVRDLLEEKEADVRRRDEFLAMLGHELRNPLAAIRYAIRLLSEIDESEATRTPREVIGRQTTHLAHLVDDLLDVARVTRGKIALDLKPLDLNEMARRTLQTIEAAHHDGHGKSRHHLTFRPAPHPLWIQGDAVRIEQIFSNLLFNAIKYTPPGGHIEFSLRGEGHSAIMNLQDDGIGMASELLERVFDLFSQAKHSIDRSRGGLGIGLTLVRGLVELHGGRILASSAGLGQGSCFEVSFPRLQVAASPSGFAANVASSAARRVLLIEDNADSREVLRLLLQRDGHAVEVAADGREGLEKVLHHRPEIALVDIGLPILDGYEVATQARAALGDAVFLVALTGYGQPEDRQRALSAGFNEHLTKPVEPARLQELLGQIASAS